MQPAPKDYDYWITNVAVAKDMIKTCEHKNMLFTL